MVPPWLADAKGISLSQFQFCIDAFYEWFFIRKGATLPTVERNALKVVSEVGEWADEIAKSGPLVQQEDEWADTMFALLHTAIIADYDIAGAMQRIAIKNYEKFETAVVINGMIIKKEDWEKHHRVG